jgi:hypothetical protein
MADAIESKTSLRAFFNKPLELTIIGLKGRLSPQFYDLNFYSTFPILIRLRRINPPEADKTFGYADKSFNAAIISKSSSNYNSPGFLILYFKGLS